MHKPAFYLKYIFLYLALIYSLSGFSQQLIKSRKTSYYTYIYQITGDEAKKIYKKGKWKLDPSFFHTLVDSFPTDSQYKGKLEKGHYLKTFTERNKQKLSITTVQDFEVFILNNNTDLCIQVYDLEGKIIEDADVRVRWKKLSFNQKTQSYLDKKSNQKGLLKVTCNGFTTYYNLSRRYNNSFIKRGARKFVYQTPIKYVWRPVNFFLRMPVDGVKSIIRGWPQGSVSRTVWFFRDLFDNVACIFDDTFCEQYNHRFSNKHTGYIVFNKPKYLPGDTVRFKAFLVTQKGKPVNKQVKVILRTNSKLIHLTSLSPYRKGGYKYKFHLHDSLQLRLDRRCAVHLLLKERKKYITGYFTYEDYELSKKQLKLHIKNKKHYKNQKLKLFVQGTDENDFNLLDARIEVCVSPKSIDKIYEKQLFIPDTLLYVEKKLDPSSETAVVISDSLFPKIDFKYEINVRMLTSDNELKTKIKEVQYTFQSEKLIIDLQRDSIEFTFEKNGIAKPKEAIIYALDNFGNKTQVYTGFIPCKLKLNPYYSTYTIKSDSLSSTKDISIAPSLIQCFSERTPDSVFIIVNNPRKIPFTYNIYKRNTPKSAGYTKSLKIKRKANTKQKYYISIRYLWGGEINDQNYQIPLKDKKLNISVTQPKIVYPGQKTTIEVLVTDSKNEPVEGVDLTAYSITRKFDYLPPDLPYLGKKRKKKEVINNFNYKKDVSTQRQLDYESWKADLGIDTIAFYQFIYPRNSISRFEYVANDSLTQFAPFVVSDGKPKDVHVIYVDRRPVYFSWSTTIRPYSFPIDSGYHQIKLRTEDEEIIIDSLFFNKGKKMIFSLNPDFEQKNVNVNKRSRLLTESEKNFLYKYIFPYENNFGGQIAYLKDNNSFHLLNSEHENRYVHFAGPVSGHLSFHLIDSFSINFQHEPYSKYTFSHQLLKIKSFDKKRYPGYFFSDRMDYRLDDEILTRQKIQEQWNNYLESIRYSKARYIYPNRTSKGAGRLFLDIKRKPEKNKIVNILLFKYDNHNFFRVYPGNTELMHDLKKGYHKLILFYQNAKYHIVDSVFVNPNGLNYYQFGHPQHLKKDSFSVKVSKLIDKTIFKPFPSYYEKNKELRQIYNNYQQQFSFLGNGKNVQGYVYEKESGEPLPGVNVVVKGTTYGTVTNQKGYYSLMMPADKNILSFSFVGFNTKEKNIGHSTMINANLDASTEKLSEVVVIGYGVTKSQNLTSSVSVVSSENIVRGISGVSGNISQGLQGKVSGVCISSNNGKAKITVRRASTVEFDKTPLYIINGNVYTGDISALDPEIIQGIEILKDEAATAMYGAIGANGVVLIQTEAGAFKPAKSKAKKDAEYDDAFFAAASQSSSIRDNFADYAFWRPCLITDENGKASFKLTFPDDVTCWNTFYLAMNGKRQSGQTRELIKSYKPLIAQLSVPRFLLETDTSHVIGKSLNYSPDSIKITTQFEINGQNKQTDSRYCINSFIDTLLVVAQKDTLSVKYKLEKEDGYFDGEIRKIPVFPLGLQKTKGHFYVLDNDTSIQLNFDASLGPVNLYAKAGMLDVIEEEISHLINYRYLCNEQIASKIKVLIAEENIAHYKGKKFKKANEIKRLIRLLNRNQTQNGLWGWWGKFSRSYWISLHVIEALTLAEQMGYDTKINKNQFIEFLIWELENKQNLQSRLKILNMLKLLNAEISYRKFLSEIQKDSMLTLNDRLRIIDLKQRCNIDYYLDTIEYYQKKTMFGNIYFADESEKSNLTQNDIQNTLLAYRIFKNDTLNNDNEILTKIRNYFFEKRSSGYWRNTYESAQIIETILPDLMHDKPKPEQPTLRLKGDINKIISSFPFEMQINPKQQIQISKQGDLPVYFTGFQKYWDSSPSPGKEDFEIYTSLNSAVDTVLLAGKPVTLTTRVVVEKDAEYVMINIPVPAGCSYVEKKNNYNTRIHREYFKNETTIFCESLSKGEYIFKVELIPKYTGKYTINPAKIELMYFPVFNANNGLKRVEIK